ncbi:MAG: hypothetical protein G8345_22310 [Magnetococcales bacterium]|nr:hypothetical protein [Magnetococcales bacterium]
MNAEPVNKVGVYAFPASLAVKKALMIALRAPLFNTLLMALLATFFFLRGLHHKIHNWL